MAVDPDLRRAVEAMQPAELDELQQVITERRDDLTGSGKFIAKFLARRRIRSLPEAVLWSLFTLTVFVAVDAAVFHSGWYMHYLEPNSSAGQVEGQIFWLRHEPERVETAVFGDSRIGEGFSARTAMAATGDQIHFRNMGVAGSTARVWYYLLRDADPERRRFSTVVFALDRYSDQDGENQGDRISDLNYVVGRLRFYDCPEFALSFRTAELRSRALAGCLLRGIALRSDLRSLLENPSQRFKIAKDWRNNGHGYLDGYGGKPEDLAGLTVDYSTRTIHFPVAAKRWQRDIVQGTLLPEPTQQNGSLRAYRAKWLGKIVDFYAGTKTRVVFFEVPRGPVHPQEAAVPAYVIGDLRKRPNVTVLPPESFRDLELPELFADGLHLNHSGRPIFSAHLARKLMEVSGQQ